MTAFAGGGNAGVSRVRLVRYSPRHPTGKIPVEPPKEIKPHEVVTPEDHLGEEEAA